MPRNIVVCCDGTSNEFAADRTNVAKLCFALIKDQARQLAFYHPGVGTMAPPGFVTGPGAALAKTAGLAFGYALKSDIRDAYVFIMNNYREGDRLFLFGFSRGAYTARVVAALLHMYGLTMPGNEALIPYAIRMLWAIHRDRKKSEIVKSHFQLAREFKASLSGIACNPHFLGVWDTVSSVGWIGSPVGLPYTRDNPDIATARHAVSIDEHRAFFRTNLLVEGSGRDIKQVWFPGVHCDVGGGYPEKESGLSKIALAWMASEAAAAGLLIDTQRLDLILGKQGGGYSPADPKAKLHDSLSWPWWPAEYVPKRQWDRVQGKEVWRVNRFRRRAMGPSPLVHSSAWEVGQQYASALPGDAVRVG